MEHENFGGHHYAERGTFPTPEESPIKLKYREPEIDWAQIREDMDEFAAPHQDDNQKYSIIMYLKNKGLNENQTFRVMIDSFWHERADYTVEHLRNTVNHVYIEGWMTNGEGPTYYTEPLRVVTNAVYGHVSSPLTKIAEALHRKSEIDQGIEHLASDWLRDHAAHRVTYPPTELDPNIKTIPAPVDLLQTFYKEVDPGMKDTNPKDAIGIKKIPISTVPHGVILALGVAMLEGALKYARHNYREAGVRASVYRDAENRHMTLWWDFGQDIDPDSNLNHIVKAMASLTVLLDGIQNGTWVDDRPPPLPIELYHELQAVVNQLVEKYRDPPEPVTAKSLAAKRSV